jgi:dihydrolipoamide dehydrogenase
VSTVEIRVPNIGTFSGVPVVEVHVGPGSEIQPEDPLITLESDKASLEVPAPQAGTVRELAVSPGDRLSEGDLILVLDTLAPAGIPPKERVTEDAAPALAQAGGADYGSPSGVYNTIEVRVPNIGDFAGVQIVDVHVSPGTEVNPEDPLITLETDKASMEVPAPAGGTVDAVTVRPGDRVSQGDLILMLRVGAATPADSASVTLPPVPAAARTLPPPGPADVTTELLVLGAGPGGYTAAFRAADLGKRVLLVDRRVTLGGVCLNVGCIPSKALLHAARVLAETREMSEHGLSFGEPHVDLDRLRVWKDGVVKRLTTGLAGLARQRKVTVLQGSARFVSPNELEVETADRGRVIARFEHAIIAVGSEPVTLPFIPHQDPRVLDSTGALELHDVPRRLLVLGAGIIGLEMATVYQELGAEITIAELMDQIIPGADSDIVSPLMKRIEHRYANIFLKTKVTGVEARPDGLAVRFEGPTAPATDTFDKLLVAVGRRPNGRLIGAENAGVFIDDRGFIPTDRQMRTNVPTIFAIGDVVGQPMLAHKATHEGRVAAEVAAGMNSSFDARVIPSVAYTDPEVAWVGLTETEARAKDIKFGKAVFPWAASGRALSLDRDEGLTKLLFNPETHRVVGGGIVGPGAGELISELALAIEMGADAEDIGLTIHPHPTLSETVGMAAEAFEGTITDLYLPKTGRTRDAVHAR